MQIIKQTFIDFLGKRKFFYMISSLVIIAGLVTAFTRGVELGIDFEGGTEAAFEFLKPVEINAIRSAIAAEGFQGAELKSYGGENKLLIRVANQDQTEAAVKVSDRLQSALTKSFPDNPSTLLKSDNIGPKIGAELRNQALMAIVIGMAAVLLFITVRYEVLLGLGAIIALIHDVLVTFAFVVIFNGFLGLNLEMNQGMLAAFLTVVGFSINDTVVNFDRIRENRTLHRGENMMMLINRSINETLPRTLLTGLCVALVLLILLFFSGEVLRGFAFTLLVGLITGTYSSIYIAGSFVVDALIFQKKLDPDAKRTWWDGTSKVQGKQRTASVQA